MVLGFGALEAAAYTGLKNWDAGGFFAGLATTGRGNTVDQAFQKRFAAIDYRIQKEGLRREDIRDLVDLTTGRMDIYHVVGTLLLTFVISWYTDNTVFTSKMPSWFLSLFLISNFGAAGYLILSVWFAMHASIVAHSVGTKLLTNYARLSIPSQRYIEGIKIPIYPFLQDFLALCQRSMDSLPTKSSDSAASASSSKKCKKGLPAAERPLKVAPSARVGHSSSTSASSAQPGIELGASPSAGDGSLCTNPDSSNGATVEDAEIAERRADQEHFFLWLQEQKRWLCYDAYARVCMTLGMNQLLQALCYYILAVVWDASPTAAISSFVAVKVLSFLLVIVDVRVEDSSRMDRLVAGFTYFFPEILACILMLLDEDVKDEAEFTDIAASLIFIFHSTWLWYISHELLFGKPVVQEGRADNVSLLPRRLRQVAYLDVINTEARTGGVQRYLEEVRRALTELQEQVDITAEREATNAEVIPSVRHSSSLQLLSQNLEQLLERASVEHAGGDASGMEELRSARHYLDHFAMWVKTPEILAAMEALRDPAVKAWLSEGQREELDLSYKAFLQRCRELKLGVTVRLPEGRARKRRFRGVDLDEDEDPVPLPLAEREEWHFVRVDTYNDVIAFPQSVWLDTISGDAASVLFEPPVDEGSPARVVSFNGIVRNAVPQFMTMESTPEVDGIEPAEVPATRLTRLPSFERGSAPPPGDPLPGKVTRYFTLGSAGWWLLAAFTHWSRIHIVHKQAEHSTTATPTEPHTLEALEVSWPEPSGFFRVSALHCDDARLWISGSFSLHETALPRVGSGSRRVGSLKELGDAPVGAVLCSGVACSMFTAPQRAPEGFWSWVPALGGVREATPIPGSWRIMAAARALPCGAHWGVQQALAPLCGDDVTLVAGWDGAKVVVATMRRNSTVEAWKLRLRFEVDPGLGSCSRESKSPSGCNQSGLVRYDDVRALHFNGGGRYLAVLSSGILDTWDLSASILLMRRRLSGTHTAMCCNSKHFILSRPGARGPVLEAVSAASMSDDEEDLAGLDALLWHEAPCDGAREDARSVLMV